MVAHTLIAARLASVHISRARFLCFQESFVAALLCSHDQCCTMIIYLQKPASIQPRTSLAKFLKIRMSQMAVSGMRPARRCRPRRPPGSPAATCRGRAAARRRSPRAEARPRCRPRSQSATLRALVSRRDAGRSQAYRQYQLGRHDTSREKQLRAL